MDRYRLYFIGSAILAFGALWVLLRRIYRSVPQAKENLSTCESSLRRIIVDLENHKGFLRYREFSRIGGLIEELIHQANSVESLPLASQKKKLLLELLDLENRLPFIRAELNARFIESEKRSTSHIFNEMDGKPLLTSEQINAVLMDDDQNLIIAGAGSGKTRVIDFKVRYLVQHKGIDPSQILLLSFSRKSAQDLNQKIASRTKGVTARTIHSLAASIVGSSDEFQIIDGVEHERSIMILESLEQALKVPEGYRAFAKFYWNFFFDVTPLIHHKNISDLRRELSRLNSSLLPFINEFGENELEPTFRTLKGEYVRSVDERYIADFLFLHGVEYEYERPYPHYSGKYHPDFYLPKFNIYWEHFALTKEGTAPAIFSNPEQYVKGVSWKRELHKRNNTKLIETETWRLNEENSDVYLRSVLDQVGILINEKLSELAYKTISQGIAKLFAKFYNAHTLSGRSIQELKMEGSDPKFYFFLRFYELFYNDLRRRIEESRKLDFCDLLIKATELVQSKKQPSYSHIVVDEFQDTSNLAMNFINAVAKNNEPASLTCVGDDWQSIYGFNGSDVSLLTHFTERNPGVSTSFLESNFRSHQRIVDLGSAFISKNGSQIKKNVVSKNTEYADSEVAFLSIHQMDRKISSIPKDQSIFVLYRYNLDCPTRLNCFQDNFTIDQRGIIKRKKESDRDIEFMTIHASKGLEARHVFIVFPDGEKRTFPSEIEDHFVFELVRSSRDSYPFAEERRLFYVALSRAKQNVYLVSRRDVENSAFWEEVKGDEHKARSSE